MTKNTREDLLIKIFGTHEFESDAIMRVHYWHMYCDRAEAFGLEPLEFEEWLDLHIKHHVSPKL